MDFSLIFKTMPLPVLAFALPLFGAAAYGLLILYNDFIAQWTRKPVELPRLCCKLPFLLLLCAGALISALIWKYASGASNQLYVFTGGGWSDVLSPESGKKMQAALRVDALGATSAALMSFVALAAGLRALAERRKPITPRVIMFFLLACAGIQGIFFLNNLLSLFFFLMITQLGVTGLYRGFSARRARRRRRHLFYYLSRLLLLAMFLAGAMILRSGYDSTNVSVLASVIEPSRASLWAFVLLVVPLLYIFVKPSPILDEAAKNCFFGIRTQATLFIVFRVVFSLYGPMRGLQKVPLLFMMLGVALLFLALAVLSKEPEPSNFMDSLIFCVKGAILVSMGVAMNGSFSAERAALYGVDAIESMISLWLVFLPLSAAFAIVTVFLKEPDGKGAELWRYGRLFKRFPFVSSFLLLLVAITAGLPPFIGYEGRQLLLRSANFISPFLTLLLFSLTAAIFFSALRFVLALSASGGEGDGEGDFEGVHAALLPIFLLLLIFAAATLTPGRIFADSVSPSVESLINRTVPRSLSPAGRDG